MATKAATTKKASTSRKTVSTKTKTTSVNSAAASTSRTPSFSESVRQLSFWRSLSAELIGTFFLAATVILLQGNPLYVMFAFIGIVLLVGATSGAHINPAITIAAWATRRISWIRAIGYIAFQILGALLALLVLNLFLGGASAADSTNVYSQAPSLFKAAALPAGKEVFVLFSELIGTLILGFAVANALRAGQERLTAAFTAGFGIFLALVVVGSIGTSSYVAATAIINPAVAFSLNAISFNVWPIAVYLIAPIVGGILGFFLNDLLKGRSAK